MSTQNRKNALRTQKALRVWAKKATDTFEAAIGEGAVYASRALQKKINKTIDKPTRWTMQAVGNTNFKNRNGSKHEIFIKGARDKDKKIGSQDDYLKHYFDGGKINKLVPILNGKVLDPHGNIKAIKNGKFINGKENGNFVKIENTEGTFIVKKYKPKTSRVKRAKNGSALAKKRVEQRRKKAQKRIVAVKTERNSTRQATLGSWESNEAMMLERIHKHIANRMKYV
ncbi:hypothetical protein [Salmonella enterica]|uniref:hypothetical protein n=1 Tax=Salmonella enterica TaxID=28901 RepID=UPI000D5709C2|nr:hypothetical protein [Salmonella enterica]PVO50884.1 hypothetical protein C4743_06080 [Salmonella enterica subsp. enterica serovar Newport]